MIRNGPGNGGQLCLRARGSGEPLWPWPMRDRILAATTAEERYPTPESLDPGSWTPQPVDIHETVEGMFGPIPPSGRDAMAAARRIAKAGNPIRRELSRR